ncbi:MAG: hypothetical protein DRI34_01380 [Deltaproteobacteria bacterium]|nr:MAG: hypothetical protein DRI34_01380 [Deltaproteobacteria bacterium]
MNEQSHPAGNLRTEKRYVDDVAKQLLGPLLDPMRHSAWRLAGWDAEQGISIYLEKDGRVLLVELEPRNDEQPCYACTARFNVCARRPFDFTSSLDAEDRRVVDSLVAMITDREKLLPWPERQPSSRRRAVRLLEVERVLMGEGRGHYYINPYVGCTIGCPFCYVAGRADLSRRLEGLPRLPWGHFVDVKVNAAEVLREEVQRVPAGIVRLSPILTDPYQPVERKFRITRQCLQVLQEAGFTAAVLTRAALVTEDLELLKRFPTALVGFSIPSDDDRMRQLFEPGADPLPERLRALAACRRAGLVTLAFIQPMLPMNVERLVEMVAPLVDAVRIDRMYCLDEVTETYRGAGLEHATRPRFFRETEERLKTLFARRGVLVEDIDDVKELLRRLRNRGGGQRTGSRR